MAQRFEWDTAKAASNVRKHGVSFEEAASVFSDPLAYTFPDPDHGNQEVRLLSFGHSRFGRLLAVAHAELAVASESSARAVQPGTNEASMSTVKDDMRAEYRREDLGKGVRGKYFERVSKGSNLVLLDDQVAKAFPTARAVNEALLGLLALTEQTARITARSKRTLRKRADV